MSRDVWDNLASKHLTRLVMTAALKGGRDYAPDQTQELSRLGRTGPISAQISEILQRHANLWANDMRTAVANDLDVEQEATWNACVDAAHAEIDKFMAGHTARRAG